MRKFINLVALVALLLTPAVAWSQTDCTGYTSVPYTTGFEGLSTGSLPACWTALQTGVNGSTTFPCAYSYSGNTHNGSVYFEFESSSSSSDTEIVALPRMQNVSGLKLTMWVSASSSYPCSLEVGVMEADSSFTPVSTVSLTTFVGGSAWQANYHEYTVYMASYTGSGEHIALRAVRTGSGQFTMFLDDVTVSEDNGCYPLSNLVCTDTTTSSLTIAWSDDMNTTPTYTVEYWKLGGDTTTVTGISDTTYTATGLDASSLYYFVVYASCTSGNGDPVSGSFATACDGSTCEITVSTSASYNSYYYQPTAHIYQNGVELGSVQGAAQNISVCSTVPVNVVYQSPNYSYSPSATVTDIAGTVLFSGSTSSYSTGDTLVTIATPCPTCIPPMDLTDSATTDEIYLSWTPRSGATLFAVYLGDSLVNDNVTDTFYTFQNLNANTAYTVGVQSICSSDDSSAIATVTVRTACGPMSLPFFDDFDSYANGEFPPCWQRIRAHGTDASVNTQYHHSGSMSMYLASNNDTTLFVTPTAIPLDGNNIFVRYQAYMYYSSWTSMTKWIKAGVMTDPNDLSTFIALDSLEYHDFNYEFEEREFNTAGLSADSSYYVAWMYFCSYSYYNTGAIDDVYINSIPSCLRVREISLAEADSESVTLTWVDTINTGASYTVYYWANGSTDTLSVTANDTIVTLTGLTANTGYTMYLVPVCGSDNAEASPTFSFRTACGTTALPFFVDFEDAAYNGAWYPCWDSIYHAGTDPSVNNVRNHTDGGQYAMYLQVNSSQQYNLVVGPPMNATGDNIYCRFWAYLQFSGSWIQAGVITNPHDTTTFIPLVTVNNTGSWGEYEFTTDTLDANANYRVAWLAYYPSTSSYGNQVGEIDDIYVGEIPACPRVSSVSIDSITSESITVSWVDTLGSASLYTITCFGPEDTTVVTTYDTIYEFDNLAANTAYSFSVVPNCSNGDGEATFVSARTACSDVELPFTESFEESTGYADCWTLEASGNIGGTYGMGYVTLNGHRMLRFSSYSTASDYNQYGYSPQFEDASSYSALQVRVRYATYNSNNKLNFGYITPTDTVWDATDYTTSGSSDFQYYEAIVPSNTRKIAIHYYGNYSYYAWIDSVIVNPLETAFCFAVTNPVVSNITSDGATVSWTADASQSTWLVVLGNDTTSVNDTTYTFTGLDARTQYTVYIAADCSDDTSDWTSTTFLTDCAGGSCDITVAMTDSWGDGWNGNAQINFYQNGSLAGAAKLASGGSGTATVSVCSGLPVTFSWQSGTWDAECGYVIYDGSMSEVYSSATSGVDYSDSIENACPSCYSPDSLVVTLVDSNELAFAWYYDNTVSDYLVSFDGSSWTSAYSGTYNAYGLTPNTSHTFSVKAVCQPGDTSNARTVTVKTACGQMVIPYAEGFENDPTGGMPSCWSSLSTSPEIVASNYSLAPHTGSQHLGFEGNSMAITSAVPLNGDSIYVEFWALLDDYYSVTLEAGVMTNPLVDTTFIPLLTVTSAANNGVYTHYEFNTASLTGYYDSTFYVAFRNSGSTWAQAFIDDVNIRVNEGCMYPAGVVATPGAHTIDLVWSNVASTMDFVVTCRAASDSVWDSVVYVNDTTYSITGLNAATDYVVRIGFLCYSDTLWTTVTVQTTCDLLPLPYFENFDSYANDVMPPCWEWSTVSATHWDGGVFLRGYHGGGSEYVVVPQVAGNITKLQIEFDCKVGTIAEQDGILFGVADASGTLLQWLDTIQDVNHSRNNHVHHILNMLNYTLPSGAARIAFAQYRNWNEWALIDNINITELPDCYPIDSLEVHNIIDPDHTSFTWASLGTESQWQVYVDTVTVSIDSIPDSLFTTVSTRSYEIPVGTIQGGGIYKFYVRSDCSFEQSNWTSYEFGAGTYVMSSSSTADTIVACGLVVYDNGGPVAGYLPNSSSALVIRSENVGSELQIFGGKFGWGSSTATLNVYDGEGTGGALLYTYSTIDGRDTLLDTILATTTTGAMTITFNVGGSMCHTGYELYIHCVGAALCERPTQLNAVMTEVGEATVSWSGTASAYDLYYKPTGASTWNVMSTTSNNVVLTGLIPDTVYNMEVVGICGTDTSIASFPIELNTHYDVVITPCDPVSALTVINVTNTTATLGWTSDGSEWEIEVVRVGLTDTVTANTNPYTLTGLLPNMQYTVRVRTVCSGVHVDPYSDWSSSETFTTPLDGPQSYTLNVVANNDAWGTVTGGGTYVEGTTVTITATPNEGYYFDRWNDGNTDSVRTVTVTGNITYTANFAANGTHNNYYVVSVSANNPAWGTVTGGGEYMEGATATITATANTGYHFEAWNDGNTDAIRTFTVTESVSFVANFAANTGIDNVEVYTMTLYPNPASNTVTVSFEGIEGQTMVEIVDISGRTVVSESTSESQTTLNIGKLAQGAYFVRVTGEKATAVSRLIVR